MNRQKFDKNTFDLQQNLEYFENSWAKKLLLSLK